MHQAGTGRYQALPPDVIGGELVMQCVECNRTMSIAGLSMAMEQRQHFALVRNAEACQACAAKTYALIERVQNGRHTPGFHGALQCTHCHHGAPIIRLRFSLRDHCHDHVALCEKCYGTLRDDLLRNVPNIVSFLEKEWQTGAAQSGKRLPVPVNTRVVVKKHVARFHDMAGRIIGFRGLVQPWYGYEVEFDAGGHHFFHERDLEFVDKVCAGTSAAAALPGAPVGFH